MLTLETYENRGKIARMGLLSLGTPLSWEEAVKHSDHVRSEGIKQFINAYNQGSGHNPNFWTWGDEVEYVLVDINDETEKVTLNIKAERIIDALNENPDGVDSIWHPEYAKFMLESTPLKPYSRSFKSFLDVERNMKQRRVEVSKYLGPSDRVLSLANFPGLGTISSFSRIDGIAFTNEASRSCFIPDEVINSHVRFKTLTRNIRIRRGQKVEISLPLFQDEFTDPLISSKQPCFFPHETVSPLFVEPNQVYMDCMAFGMGCCCLQITMLASDISEARYLYDQYAIIAPIMLALTAASPIFRGILVDTDCRWSVIESSVDDRTREERGLDPLLSSTYKIPKSRYASVSRFISKNSRPEYNDIETPVNETILDQLNEAGIDQNLSMHLAHLFIRDPLVIFRELLHQDNAESLDHFENIQSTNWQTCRFKPPSLTNPELGWRVEFRPMEVQLTDRENAAFAVYSVLLARTILHFQLSLYLPISLVDLNLARAQKRDAVINELFYSRTNMTNNQEACSISLRSLDDIINNPEIGFNHFIRRYLHEMAVEPHVLEILEGYLKLVSDRAAGRSPTPANLIRNFVLKNPHYAKDSLVSDKIIYDLVKDLSNLS